MAEAIEVAVLTVSDKGSRGEREDLSHGAIVEGAILGGRGEGADPGGVPGLGV